MREFTLSRIATSKSNVNSYRTGSSSPLGELFDHGCDSITMGLLGIITGATVRMGGILTLIGLVVGWGPFYLAHWEEYHTGILIMGKFNGPTEAQLIVIGIQSLLTLLNANFSLAILLVTAIAGSGIWVHDLFYIGHTAIRLNYICFAFSVIFSIITVAQNFHKVLSLASRNMPTKEALMQLLPFSCLVVLSLVWLGTEHAMLVAQPHVPLMTISLIFAYLTSRLIVNRVCKESTQPFHAILVPLFIATMLGVIGAVCRNSFSPSSGTYQISDQGRSQGLISDCYRRSRTFCPAVRVFLHLHH